MSKIYDALKLAERERSAEQRDTLTRLAERVAAEHDILRAEIAACQEQLAALATRVDAAPTIDPAAIDDLGQRIGQLAAQQERLAKEPRQLLESALQQFNEDLSRRTAAAQSQSAEFAGVSLPLDGYADADLDLIEKGRRSRGGAPRPTLAQGRDDTPRATPTTDEWVREQRRVLETELAALRAAQQEAAQPAQRLAAEAHALATDVGKRVDELAALEAKLQALGAEQQIDERIDRATENLRAAVHDLCSRVDDLGHESQEARASLQADVASLHQQLGEALHDRDERRAALADEVQTAQRDQQQVLTDLRQQVAAGDALHASARSELRQQVTSAADQAGAALRRLETLDGGLQNHAALLGKLETAHAELRALVQRCELQVGELTAQTAQAVGEQAQRAEALSVLLADAEAARKLTAQRWQEDLERLRAPASESNAALDPADKARIDDLQTGLAAVLERLAGAEDERRELQQRWEEQLAEQRQALSSLSAEVMRVAAGERNDAPTVQQDLGARLAAAEEAQSATDHRLLGVLDAVQVALTGQQQSVDEINALRTQVAPLANMPARLQEFSEVVARAQATADEAGRRVAAIAGAPVPSLGALRQQLAAVPADRGFGRGARSRRTVSAPGTGRIPVRWLSAAAVLAGIAVMGAVLGLFVSGKAPVTPLIPNVDPQLRDLASSLGLDDSPAPASQSAVASADAPAILKGLVNQDAAGACSALATRCAAACQDKNVGGLQSLCVDVLKQTRSTAANPSRQSVDKLVKMTGSCRTWCVLAESAKQAGVSCDQLGAALSAYSSAPRSGFKRQCGWYST